jgi:hypothetical protein
MPNLEQRHDEHSGIAFTGSVSAQKRLTSAGMEVFRIAMYMNRLGHVWEADTSRGKRWVSYSEIAGWNIAKVPPMPRVS